MDLDEFLELHGTGLPSVVREVRAKFGLDSGDLVLAVGSTVEGLGNRKSDLDLVLITPKSPAELGATGEVTMVVDRCLIDLRLLPSAEINALLDRFVAWVERPWNVTHSAKFTVDERTLLHRLRHGEPLHAGEDNVVTQRLPSLVDLARLKLHIARQNSRTIQVDMVGYRETGDYRSLVFAAQELLGHAVDALVAGYGLTNPLVKWRCRMLELLPADWERSLTIRPVGRTAAEHVWRLHRAPERPDEVAALEHSFAISTFARAVFAWASRDHLGGSGAEPPTAWHEIEADDDGAPLPFLDFDVDFALTKGGAAIGRLNEFGRALNLSPAEFALTLLFDGTTTAREALAAVRSPDPEGRRAAARLVAKVQDEGFCVDPSLASSLELSRR